MRICSMLCVSRVAACHEYCLCRISLSLSLSLSESIGSSVVRYTLLPPDGLEFNPGLGQPLSGLRIRLSPKSLRGNLKPDRSSGITGHPDLCSPCPGIIRLAGRTAGKNPSSQSEAARCTPGALTGRCPAVPGTSRPDSRGVQARSLSLSLSPSLSLYPSLPTDSPTHQRTKEQTTKSQGHEATGSLTHS